MMTVVVGDAIEVYWPTDAEYYCGQVAALDTRTNIYLVHYDDDEIEELDLSQVQWRFKDSANRHKTNGSTKNSSIRDVFAERSGTLSALSVLAPLTAVDPTSPTNSQSTRQKRGVQGKRKSTLKPTRRSKRVREQASQSKQKIVWTVNSIHCEKHTPDIEALKLIEYFVNYWMHNENRRQYSMFSICECLTHTFNMLTTAAANQMYLAKIQNNVTHPKWILNGILSDSSRAVYNRWRQPHSDDEWGSEKLMIAKISACVHEGAHKSLRLEHSSEEKNNTVVEAMRYVSCARSISRY